MRIIKIIFAFLLFSVVAAPIGAYAQAASYVDESGTIHFADDVSQVPDRYKGQVIKQKPKVLSKKEYRDELTKWKHKHSEEEKLQKKKEKEKEKERKKVEREMQRRDQKHKNDHSSSASKDSKFNSEANATPAPIVR